MQKKILYGVLNWGLGHATRSVPIIQNLIDEGNKICLAGNGKSLHFLIEKFPELEYIKLSKFNIKYSKHFTYFNWWKISFQILKLYFSDRKFIKKTEHEFDFIISDNRYGLFSKKSTSVFISHQCNIIPPKGFKSFSVVVNLLNKKLINQFEEMWIPDEKGNTLSGKLSHKCNHKKFKYIGPISRLKENRTAKDNKFLEYKVLVILSGPEPYRNSLESLLIEKLEKLKLKSLLIAGRPLKKTNKHLKYVEYKWHLNDTDFSNAICTIPYIIARAGYSTILDLYALKKTALIIPTPKQSEQIYLANYLHNKRLFTKCQQSEISSWTELPKLV